MADPKPKLDYATPAPTPSTDGPKGWVIGLAVALAIALMTSGIASDHVRFTLAKKLGFTLAAAVILALIAWMLPPRRSGCTGAFTLYVLFILLHIAVMWFWN